jgi:hypothetical protein
MRHPVKPLRGSEDAWAAKLKKEAESWHRRKSVPMVAHKGVQVIRLAKRKFSASAPTLTANNR